jgi:hypothetical protein
MPSSYKPFADQTRATFALLKFCEDHGYKCSWLKSVRQCLLALENSDILAACNHFREVPFGGNGCFDDWMPPVVFEHETDEYVRATFEALAANWTLLMNEHVKGSRIPIGPQPAEGLVILLLQIRDEERRQQAIHHIVNLPCDRVNSRLYEISTGNWDDGLWDEEVDWFVDLLEGSNDSIVVWRFTNGCFSRFTLGAGG